jgi:acyl dehydratase
MRLDAKLVGATAGPRAHEVDARWLMAYAAALGETRPAYLDTAAPGGIVAHPLFPVCYEWPLVGALRAATMPPDVAARGVHATHDLRLHRRPRPGERLSTTATVTGLAARPPGAYVVTRLETVDADGRPVSTTDYGTIYRGVAVAGEGAAAAPATEAAPAPAGPEAWSAPIAIAAGLAHVYSECARIWNPIHTDRAAALAAGLPDVILHGTATLALAVSALLVREAAGPATAVRRIGCRFGAMVRMPSTVTLRSRGPVARADGRWLGFDVVAADGPPALRDGWLVTAG